MPDRFSIMTDVMYPLVALTILTMPFFNKPQVRSQVPPGSGFRSATIAPLSPEALKEGVILHIEMQQGELFYSLDGEVFKDIPLLGVALRKLGSDQPGKVIRMKVAAGLAQGAEVKSIIGLCLNAGLLPLSNSGEKQ